MQQHPSPAAVLVQRRFPGFTIVELLVVIGIIALLVSILMPALNRARQQAQTAQCLSNLRQIGAAVQMYANDNKGFLVPCEWRDPAVAGGTTSTDGWPVILVVMHYLPYPTQSASENAAASTVFRCPAGVADISYTSSITPVDRQDQICAMGEAWGSNYLQPGLKVYCWYSMNAASSNSTGSADIPGYRVPLDGNAANNFLMHKMTQLKDSAELVLFFDGVNINAMSSPNRINARHNNRTDTNLLFADGHAETIHTDTLFANPRGSYTATSADSSLKNLQANVPWPHWRIDQ